MKSAKLYVYAGSVLLVLSIVLVWAGKNKVQKPADSKNEIIQPKPQLQPKPQRKIANSEVPALSTDNPELQQELQPPLSARTKLEVEEAFNDIEDAATSYDAEELPILEVYLFDPDPEIRQAALDGMITLGDAAASPLLRKAAENAYSAQEAVTMQQAADYLELPAGTLPFIKKATSETSPLKTPSAEAQKFERLFKKDKASASLQSPDEPSLSP